MPLLQSGAEEWGAGEAQYLPGTMLAGRYRVVSLLKRGGMGEVYRAEDLKLRQQVALKFLPRSLTRDGAALARFHGEVRLARQVSHPSVCRVFDVGEADGRPFLSMEFIDGEDLQSLLRRIGRISYGKALEISRQLCAGLAAIHGCGILHRDLKPANVMIDGRGRARIADFGVAALADEPGESSLVGTPAYVAPELWTGGKATVRSDLYALGLILYEIFTGRKVPVSSTPRRTARTKEDTRPVRPSALVPEVDPRTESAILRCLARNPAARPASALEVAAALPGADPLADAIAAGETPSPEMVVAAPTAGTLRPALASALLMVVLLGLAGILALSGSFFLIHQVPFESSPEVLIARARSLLRNLGHSGTAAESAYGWLYDKELDRWLKERWPVDGGEGVRRMLANGRPALYAFWYRQSPVPWGGPGLAVTPEIPARSTPGEAYVLLDPQGRLLELEVQPPRESQDLGAPAGFLEWTPLLAATGFAPGDLFRVGPQRNPRVYAESTAAWTGSLPGPGGSSIPIRIETAAYGGAPVSLAVVMPWSPAVHPRPQTLASRIYTAIVYCFYVAVWTTALYLAYRNLRRGRDDRRGAWRVAAAGFLLTVLIEIFGVSTLAGRWTAVASRVGADALFVACFLWLCHLGFEPYMRRHWPGRIVSWSRAIAGRLRDPLVGRDILLGCAFGIADTLFRVFLKLGLDQADVHHREPLDLRPLLGPQGLLGGLADKVFHGFFDTLTIMIFVLFLRIFVRRDSAAFLGTWALYALALYLSMGFTPFLAALLAAAVGTGIDVLAWYRFGVLAGACSLLVSTLTRRFPLTTDLSSWYAGGTLTAVLLVLGLALYGYRTTLADQPLFRGGVLED